MNTDMIFITTLPTLEENILFNKCLGPKTNQFFYMFLLHEDENKLFGTVSLLTCISFTPVLLLNYTNVRVENQALCLMVDDDTQLPTSAPEKKWVKCLALLQV